MNWTILPPIGLDSSLATDHCTTGFVKPWLWLIWKEEGVDYFKIYSGCCLVKAIVVAARSETWTVFALAYIGALDSITTRHACLCAFILFVLCWRKQTPWPESATELYWPGDRLLSAKLVATFADRGRYVVSVTDPYGCTLGFLDRSNYIFFEVASQLISRGRVDPVPEPLLLRKSGSAGNRSRTYGAMNSDH
jgi:hypothetical protein